MNLTKKMFLEIFNEESHQKELDEIHELLEGSLSKEEMMDAIFVGFKEFEKTYIMGGKK